LLPPDLKQLVALGLINITIQNMVDCAASVVRADGKAANTRYKKGLTSRVFPPRPTATRAFSLYYYNNSLMVFEVLQPHADHVERQLYRTVRGKNALSKCYVHCTRGLFVRGLPDR